MHLRTFLFPGRVVGLQALIGQLAHANPADVPAIADQIVAAGVALGGTVPDLESENPLVDDGANDGATVRRLRSCGCGSR